MAQSGPLAVHAVHWWPGQWPSMPSIMRSASPTSLWQHGGAQASSSGRPAANSSLHWIISWLLFFLSFQCCSICSHALFISPNVLQINYSFGFGHNIYVQHNICSVFLVLLTWALTRPGLSLISLFLALSSLSPAVQGSRRGCISLL